MIIRDMTPRDMDAVLAAAVSAFFNERLYAWTVPRESPRRDFLHRFFQFRFEKNDAKKIIRVAEGDDGGIAGAAVWSPPEPGAAGGNSAVFRRVFADYDSGIRDRCVRFIDTVFEAEAFFRQPAWDLGPLFVRKELQGKGVGSRLLRDRLDALDGAGVPCVLVTQAESNIRLYERFGFKPAVTIAIDDAAGLASYGMIREPNAVRGSV